MGQDHGSDRDRRLCTARYDAAMERLTEALWAGPWLMGERFTAVDVMVRWSLGWGRQYLPDNRVFDTYRAPGRNGPRAQAPTPGT